MAPSANLRGIVAMLIAVAFFSWMDAVMKLLVAHYPAMQVAALRGLTALPLVLVYVAWLGHGRQLWRVRWGLHALRGVLTVLMLVCFAWGLGALPMAEAYTLFFVAPLLITMLSIPVLKERVAPRHWLAIAAGLGGVLVALRPSGERFLSLGALAVLVAAACYAASAIAGRLLTRTDGASSLVFWTTVALALGAGLLALPSWRALRPEDAGLLLALAVTGFGGQVAITEAFRTGQASVVSAFEYSALAWGIGLDWWLWQVAPDASTLVGGAIVVASGLFLIRAERVREPALPP
ncbi:DMT family transporter [Piscinibacter sakaiensis]|uniref:Putative membrane protein n=1 Tax=Piscinibacter sakaiensis TaxID=1547922 RepID=A0A0K8NY84_PISS1|nr:DMT family transporter [Piscinibacter sakaiensis]GAP35367.1 putative membrane protein [Piscinibacter sakaiensis]